MPGKIQNYDDFKEKRGYHPPACTCYQCNEERLAREAAEEEDRRVAEYDRRVAESEARNQAQSRMRNRPRGFPPSTYKPSTPPDTPPSPAPPPSGGSTGIARSHPESCPCGICSRAREIEEAERRQSSKPSQPQGQQENRPPGQSRPRGFPPSTYKPSASPDPPPSPAPPAPQQPSSQGHASSQPPGRNQPSHPRPQPPRPQPQPASGTGQNRPPQPPPQQPRPPSGSGQGQPPSNGGRGRIALLWLALIAVAISASIAAVYATSPGSSGQAKDRGGVAIAAPLLTPTSTATPEPTSVFSVLVSTPAVSGQEETETAVQEPPTPTQTPTPTPTVLPSPTPTLTPAAVASVIVWSSPADGDTYLLGETIRVAVTFSGVVNVSGTPLLKVDMDPADWGEKQAVYEGGGGTKTLIFVHEVVEPNISTQGVAVLESSLELNGGSIRSAVGDSDADLSHLGLDHDPAHRVDWRRSR